MKRTEHFPYLLPLGRGLGTRLAGFAFPTCFPKRERILQALASMAGFEPRESEQHLHVDNLR